ncbi:uncharacterized protein LOC142411974 [Mycteria americana]|uniref:uncharacterized protein LOC142411974 n=1 Tax=Mycteria americana TaxID=33587 RepID=UPI003F58F2F6
MPSPPPAPPAPPPPPPHRRRRALRTPPQRPAPLPRAAPSCPGHPPREPGPLPLTAAWGEPPAAATGHGPGLSAASPLPGTRPPGLPVPTGAARAPPGTARAPRELPVPTRPARAPRGPTVPAQAGGLALPRESPDPRGPRALTRGARAPAERGTQKTPRLASQRSRRRGCSATRGWRDASRPRPARSSPGSHRSRGFLSQANGSSAGLPAKSLSRGLQPRAGAQQPGGEAVWKAATQGKSISPVSGFRREASTEEKRPAR